jgi:serine/threonine protein kinase/tetratricopeptide (TPR) repeat protein
MNKPYRELPRDPQSQIADIIAAYRKELAGQDRVDFRRFVPAQENVLYIPVLRALVRLDLANAWQRHRPRRLQDYQREFPRLFECRPAVEELALQEYRLRQQAGENATPAEYEQGFGIDTKGWPPAGEQTRVIETQLAVPSERRLNFDDEWSLSFDPPGSAIEFEEAARAYEAFRAQISTPDAAALNGGRTTFGGSATWARFFRVLHQADPSVAERAARTASSLPKVGEEFLGFRLVRVLGQGGFGRVYLAQQADLANRFVALKVSSNLTPEPQRLARLQHANIVPIYSVHRVGALQAVCMPYLGPTTLAHVLAELRQHDTLPASGKGLMATLGQRSSSPAEESAAGNETRTAGDPTTSGPAQEAAPPELPRVGELTATLSMLEQLTYVDAVLWLGARLADGLAHAHERGIFHRDLKPANVLLTDEGQPMLLDFHISRDVHQPPDVWATLAGGTPAYMAPEHLQAFQGREPVIDARVDIYALGLMLYELLTRRRPYPVARSWAPAEMVQMLEDRHRPPPVLRCWNRAVSPAVESIVRHCLEPDPCRRYQSASELRDDLERQQNDLPLRHASEPSLRERARKWRRRHPRLAPAAVFAGITAVLLLTAGAIAWHGRRLAQEEVWQAESTYQQFLANTRPLGYRLGVRVFDPAERNAGLQQGLKAVARYHVLDTPTWIEQAPARRLPVEQQASLRSEVGEILFLLARATMVGATIEREPARHEALERALRLNGLAEASLGAQAEAALSAQRTELSVLLGQSSRVKPGPSTESNTATAQDRFLLALNQLDQRHFSEARALLIDVTREEPRNVSAWLARGVCHDRLGEYARSVACYSAAIALWPEFHMLYYDRGLAYFNQQDYDQARADFDEAIRLQPTWPDAFVDRALTWQEQKQYHEAVKDLDHALDLGMSPCRVYLLRARIRELAGDRAGAERDREAGMRLQPGDEATWRARALARLSTDLPGALADFEKALQLNPHSLRGVDTRTYLFGRLEQAWIDRGVERVERQPKAALADFERVLEINPDSWPGLMNKAHALENLGRIEEAVAILGRAAALPHENAESRSARSVLLARLGKRDAAHADAKASIADGRPFSLYRAACVYALTSRQHTEDRVEAMRLLGEALRRGCGFEYLDEDTDLDPIRSDPEFQRILRAARELKTTPPPRLKPQRDTAVSRPAQEQSANQDLERHPDLDSRSNRWLPILSHP